MQDNKVVHLFRGAPAVRAWSKYQETVPRWTLCGIDYGNRVRRLKEAAGATEDAALVSCRFCRQLMRSGERGAKPKAAGACS